MLDSPGQDAYLRLEAVLFEALGDGRLSVGEVRHVLDLVRWDCQRARSLQMHTPFEEV